MLKIVKQICKRGHARTPENLEPKGQCRTCAQLQRQERKENKKCLSCDASVVVKSRYCTRHKEEARICAATRRKEAARDGTCYSCAKPSMPGLRRCEDHAKKSQIYVQKQNRKPKGKWHNLKQAAKTRGHNCTITYEQFELLLVAATCTYCGFSADSPTGHSLDRIDNDKGYALDNVVKACEDCNIVRSDLFSFDEMKILGKTVRHIKLLRGTNKTMRQSRREARGWLPEISLFAEPKTGLTTGVRVETDAERQQLEFDFGEDLHYLLEV